MATIQGEVITIDQQGNLVTNITTTQLDGVPRDDRVSVSCDGHRTQGIFPADHDEPEMTLLACLGVNEHLELSLVGNSAAEFLSIRPGTTVTIRW